MINICIYNAYIYIRFPSSVEQLKACKSDVPDSTPSSYCFLWFT